MSEELVLRAWPLGKSPNRTRDEIREEIALLYDVRRDIVFRSLVAYTGDPAMAEDVTQEAFFRLYQRRLAGHAVDNAISWTLAVAHNMATDRLRGRKYERVISEESWRLLVDTQADPTPSFDQVLITREIHEQISALVEVLPAIQRECVQLYADGLNFKEIAESLKIPYHQALLHTRGGLARIKRLADRDRL